MGFFEETGGLIEDLQCSTMTAAMQGNLHTVKGNAAMYGFMTLAESCHAAEDAIAEATFDVGHLAAVVESFAVLRRTLTSIAGDNAGERVEVSRATLRTLAHDLAAGLSGDVAARVIERLLLGPVRPSLERLGKYARALAARMDKPELRVEIMDGGLLVDDKRAAPLFASLVHLVRNAVDHGLETRAERAASGKGEGTLLLRTSMEGRDVVITIEDDGRGVDWDRVRERAGARGLPASSMNELTSALFAAEFSTRKEATTISGRGVGLAAVQAEVTRMSGRTLFESQPGRGTRVSLMVPADALGISPGSVRARNEPDARQELRG